MKDMSAPLRVRAVLLTLIVRSGRVNTVVASIARDAGRSPRAQDPGPGPDEEGSLKRVL